MISEKIKALRKERNYSLEFVAEKIDVSRQTVSKWESGETVPDVIKCKALADLYEISLDELFMDDNAALTDEERKGKYMFGAVRVGERGQIVIPSRARKIFNIKRGDLLLFLGDVRRGMAVVPLKEYKDKLMGFNVTEGNDDDKD